MKTQFRKLLCLMFALLFTLSFLTPALMVKSDAASYKPAKVTNLQVSSKTTSTITLKWSKVSNATKYYIFRYNSRTGKYTSVGHTSSTSYKVTGLSRGTTYIFMVQSCRTVNGHNYWGSYSNHLKVTTKSSGSSSGNSSGSSSGKSSGSSTSTSGNYVGNRNSKVFHRASCSSVSKMSSGNKVKGSRSYFVSHGYSACKVCKP